MEEKGMATLQIKKEQLDIAKKWIKTGEVNIYRELITEEKNFTIPVIREELVIKKKVLSSGTLSGKLYHKKIFV